MESVANTVGESALAWAPPADVTETGEAYLVEVELPGVKRHDLAVGLAGTELSISGEVVEKERKGLFRHRTRRVGQFSYRVTLPQDVDADKVQADLTDGVLTVRVPKTEAAKPRRIAVNGE
jgi:HSP20 family protein